MHDLELDLDQVGLALDSSVLPVMNADEAAAEIGELAEDDRIAIGRTLTSVALVQMQECGVGNPAVVGVGNSVEEGRVAARVLVERLEDVARHVSICSVADMAPVLAVAYMH